MSWSLELHGGDFTVGASHLGMVIKTNKLIQDLRCAILEKMGTDNLHPDFGSLIDGGVGPDGQPVPGVIGQSDFDLVLLEIESEITRIARKHQAAQLSRVKSDRRTFGQPTLDVAEVLIEVTGIEFTSLSDQLFVKVSLQTATGQSFDLVFPLDTTLNDF